MGRRATAQQARAMQEQRFVAAFVRDLDPAKAVTEAGFTVKRPLLMGTRLLAKPRIQALVAAKQAEQLRPLNLDAARVKRELAAIAFLDPAGCFSPEGRPLHVHEMPSHVRAAVRSIRVICRDGQPVVSTVEFWSKVDALKLAAQHLALLAPKELTVNVRFPHAHLTDAELRQKLLESANAIDAEPVEASTP